MQAAVVTLPSHIHSGSNKAHIFIMLYMASKPGGTLYILLNPSIPSNRNAYIVHKKERF